MALINDRKAPPDVPTTNALAGIDVGDEPAAEIRLAGKILTVLDRPPALGETVTLMIRLEVTEVCEGIKANDELVYYRKTKLVAAWKPGDKPPADNSQPGLFDHGDDEDGDTSDGADDDTGDD